jgi:hypothetical protein
MHKKVRTMFHKGPKGCAGHWVRMALHVARSRVRMSLHDRVWCAWHCMSRGRAAQHAVRPTCRKVQRGVTNVSGSARAVAPRTKIAVGRRRATAGGPPGDTAPLGRGRQQAIPARPCAAKPSRRYENGYGTGSDCTICTVPNEVQTILNEDQTRSNEVQTRSNVVCAFRILICTVRIDLVCCCASQK